MIASVRLPALQKLTVTSLLIVLLSACGGGSSNSTTQPAPPAVPPPASSNTAPVISAMNLETDHENLRVSLTWSVTDAEQSELICTLTSSDGQMVEITDCANSTGTSLEFSEAGDILVEFTVSDGELSVSEVFNLTLEDVSPQFTLNPGEQADFPVLVRGQFNDWGTADEMVYEDGIYTFEWTGPSGEQAFKLADESWSQLDCGAVIVRGNEAPVDMLCGQAGSDNGILVLDDNTTYQLGFSYQPAGQSQIQLLASENAPSDESGLGAAGTITIYYLHSSGIYDGWGLHLWGSAIAPAIGTQWTSPRPPTRVENDYAVFEVPIEDANQAFNFIVHFGDLKSPGYDMSVVPSQFGNTLWVVQDRVAELNGNIGIPFDNEADARAAFNELLATIGNASDALDLSELAIVDTPSGLPQNWTNTANFLEIYIRAYQDSDDDGNGDIQGLISRLDYLQSNGVTGIWLMPVMESSDNDHGYETQDYRAIESDYGSMADFETLLAEAHARGITIIIDYVINHASYQNPVFLDASSSVNHPKRDWFIWESEKPVGWSVFGGDPWRSSPGGFYYGAFTERMPDFNLRNEEVIEFHQNNLKFWLNKGVDGFRFDAVGVLVENGRGQLEDQPQNHEVMHQFKDLIEQYNARYIVCEAPSSFAQFASEDSCGRAFNFSAGHGILNSAKNGTITEAFVTQLNAANSDKMPMILANHDLFAGDRIWNQLDGDEAQYRLAAASYLLTSPTPFTYYGEEIGMAAASTLSHDGRLRTPMSWTADPVNAGFSNVNPFRSLSDNAATNNVASQEGDSHSLLAYYAELWNLRNTYPELMTGELALLSEAGEAVLAITRSTDSALVVVVINYALSSQQKSINVGHNNLQFRRLSGDTDDRQSDEQGYLTLEIPGQSTLVFVSEQ